MSTIVSGKAVIFRRTPIPQTLNKKTYKKGVGVVLAQSLAPLEPSASSADKAPIYGDFYGGFGIIQGVVTELDAPVKRKVLLYVKQTAMLLSQTWSNESDGTYSFTNLDATLDYMIVVLDHTNSYEAAISTYVKAKVPVNAI